MTAGDALHELLEAAAEAGAKRALEQVTSSKPSRLVPLKQCSIGYRNALDLVRRGELETFGMGNRKFIDQEQLDAWLLNHPLTVPAADTTAAKVDEIDAIIAANHKRKQGKGSSASKG